MKSVKKHAEPKLFKKNTQSVRTCIPWIQRIYHIDVRRIRKGSRRSQACTIRYLAHQSCMLEDDLRKRLVTQVECCSNFRLKPLFGTPFSHAFNLDFYGDSSQYPPTSLFTALPTRMMSCHQDVHSELGAHGETQRWCHQWHTYRFSFKITVLAHLRDTMLLSRWPCWNRSDLMLLEESQKTHQRNMHGWECFSTTISLPGSTDSMHTHSHATWKYIDMIMGPDLGKVVRKKLMPWLMGTNTQVKTQLTWWGRRRWWW